jgi:hypothetical protein
MRKSFMSLDNQERSLDSLQARLACGNPSSHTWSRYRKICNVKSRAKLLTEREVCSLIACARLHRIERRRKVKLVHVAQEVNRILGERPEAVDALRAFTGDQPIPGRQVPEVMEKLGYKRSRRTWERHGWSPRRSYTPRQIRGLMDRVAA